MRTSFLLVVSALQLATSACRPISFAVAGDQPSFANTQWKSAAAGTSVGREELIATGPLTLREALTRTRPAFLRSTNPIVREGESSVPIVYVDERKLGGLDILELIQVGEVAQVRFLTPTAARIFYGSGCGCANGVIAVTRWHDR